ncbi:endonuclease/exonuclease/phosphatase family protein [Kitasatospora sp. NPDC051914]|uniref:endonuclease/exonuclease/phosphatase family protein n=1 Tax=Kitasatospora sp. NPDC051914 TaxID=3154945 RepID=UPI0034260F2F
MTGIGAAAPPPTPEPSGRGWLRALRAVVLFVCAVLLLAPAGLVVVRLRGLDDGTDLAMPVAAVPYAALLSVLLLFVTAVLRARLLTAVAAALTVVQLFWLVPRFVGDGEAVPTSAPRLRVATANAYVGRVDPAAVVRLVRDERVDVLAVEEANPTLAAALDRAGMAELMPYRVLPTSSDTALYSRLPLTGTRAAGAGVSAPPTTAEVSVDGRPVRLVAVHTFYPLGDSRLWAQGFDALETDVQGRARNAVLLGDFNATLDHTPMRRLLDHGLTDTHAELGRGFDGTWPADRPVLPPVLQLDHVLHGDDLVAVTVSEHTLPGTDHLAVVAELAVTG